MGDALLLNSLNSTKVINKLGLNWAKLSSSWNWVLLQLILIFNSLLDLQLNFQNGY